MTYILDTDVFTLSEYSGTSEAVRLESRIVELDPEHKLVTTIVTYEEQTRGWLAFAAKSRAAAHQVKAYGRLKRHLLSYQRIEVLDYDEKAASQYERLVREKLRVGASDLKIAAIALANEAVLISRNLKDFARIPGLRIEDWTRA